MKISIITATYNSSKYIDRVFNTIKQQSYRNFEWIAVDDLSQDNTTQLLEDFKANNLNIDITLCRMDYNSGGGAAFSHGVELAKGELIVILDHDDELIPDALSIMIEGWIKFSNKTPKLAGVLFRTQDSETGMMNGQLIKQEVICSFQEFANVHGGHWELCGIYSAKILKEFYTADKVKNLTTNGVLFARISKEFDFAFTNTIVRIYYRDNPLSQSNNPRITEKTIETYIETLNLHGNFIFGKNVLLNYRTACNLARFCIIKEKSIFYPLTRLSEKNTIILYLTSLVFLPLYILRDRLTQTSKLK